jgi:hypothetical protein
MKNNIGLAEVLLVPPVRVVMIGIVLILIGSWFMVVNVVYLLILYIYMFLHYVTVENIIEQNGDHDYLNEVVLE